MDKLTLTYSNEDDRAFGLAGMAICIAALDALNNVSEISLDSEGPMISFAHSYYFSGSPSISPKATWNNLVKNFHLTATMVVGNVMARSLVRLGSDVPSKIMDEIHDDINREAIESCSLEKDEADALYDNAVAYSRRIFANKRLYPAIREFAATLSRRRTLSGLELLDEMHRLQFI